VQAESVYKVLPMFKSEPYKSNDKGNKQDASGSDADEKVPKKLQEQPDIPTISPDPSVKYKFDPLLKYIEAKAIVQPESIYISSPIIKLSPYTVVVSADKHKFKLADVSRANKPKLLQAILC
jgi:hypothetical protein